jgi:hypothetical protein
MRVAVLEETVMVEDEPQLRRGLVLTTNVKKGEVIYVESAVVTALQYNLDVCAPN